MRLSQPAIVNPGYRTYRKSWLLSRGRLVARHRASCQRPPGEADVVRTGDKRSA